MLVLGGGAVSSEQGTPVWVSELLGSRDSEAGRLRLILFFFFTLVAGPRRSLSLKLSDTKVYEPQIRARLRLIRAK